MLDKFKIGTKLITFFLLIGIVPLGFMGFNGYRTASNAIRTESEAKLDVAAALKVSRIRAYFSERLGDAVVLADNPAVNEAIRTFTNVTEKIRSQGFTARDLMGSSQYRRVHDQYHDFLKFYNDQYGYYDLFLIDHQGKVIYSVTKEPDFGTDLTRESHGLADAFKMATSSRKVYLTDTAPYAPSNGAPALFVAAPIYQDNKLFGAVALQISQHAIDEIMQEASGMGETGETYLLGPDYLFRSNSRLSSEETLLSVVADTEGPREAFRTRSDYEGIYGDYTTSQEAEQQGRNYSDELGGVPVLGMATYIPELNWVLVAEIDESEAFAAAYSLKNNVMILILMSSLLITIAAFFISKTITNPIKKVVAMVKDIATGDGDLTVRLGINSQDELGELATWFDTFVEKLQTIIAQVKSSAKEVAAAGNEISAASEQMAAGAEEQQAQLSEVATSIEEMSAMILETSNNAEGTQSSASEANIAAEKGRGTVDQTIAGIEGIATIVDTASQQISTLKVRSQEIADVIQVIDDISDQTNLLALNANIEAARAGEAGRGFAVVADEVRKLAERTVGATADIEEKIKQIQADVNTSVDAMEQITEQSVKGQTMAGEAGQALEEISGSIEQVNGAITQIASAAIEQSAGVEEISKNIESVSTVSKQSASGAQELAASSEQLNREVQALDKLMDQFIV